MNVTSILKRIAMLQCSIMSENGAATVLPVVEELEDVTRATVDVKAELLGQPVDTHHEVRVVVNCQQRSCSERLVVRYALVSPQVLWKAVCFVRMRTYRTTGRGSGARPDSSAAWFGLQ